MKSNGAALVAQALENVGVKYTFGIPGVHNTEIYDALRKSEIIEPLLVTHEQGASFMAEAMSRVSDSLGCIVIVPGAGMTHAMSGIGEAYLDGIPLLAISGGIRRDTGRRYQLHELDQQRCLDGITKGAFLVSKAEDIVPTIYKAAELATSGCPGPVFVEVSTDVQLFAHDIKDIPAYAPSWRAPEPDAAAIGEAVAILQAAESPGLYVGWGAREAFDLSVELSELLGAPVSTTMQGLSAFPHQHPNHAGFGFGPSAVPAAQAAFKDCDALVAVGCRFAELATGSYGMPIPENLIHADVDPEVLNANYPARVAIEADAVVFMQALVDALKAAGHRAPDASKMQASIAAKKAAFFGSWQEKVQADIVSPGIFFRELRHRMADDDFVVVDDGNHTFLTAEQYPVHAAKRLISPTDFNCMGYCVPATIATKLAHPDNRVVGIVGDGAFLMTCMEITTAAVNDLGAVFFVFHDGELAQISQFQHIPLKHKTCTVMGDIRFEGVATATGAAYIRMQSDNDVQRCLDEAFAIADHGGAVIVDVNIDYSRKTQFTQGVVKVNLSRFPFPEKMRMIGRAVKRHTIG